MDFSLGLWIGGRGRDGFAVGISSQVLVLGIVSKGGEVYDMWLQSALDVGFKGREMDIMDT